jgi:PhnB protein
MIPHLIVRDGAAAIAFYKAAFGAEEQHRMPGPGGKGVAHAALRIGDSVMFLAEEGPQGPMKSPQSLGGASVSLYIYVPDADATFAEAVKAGAQVKAPLADMFWGDRWGLVEDPFGHVWQIGTRKEIVSPEEMQRRMAAMGSTQA